MMVGVAMGRSLVMGWSGSNCGKHSTSVTMDTGPESHLADERSVALLLAGAAAAVGGDSVDAVAIAPLLPPKLVVLEVGEEGDSSNWSLVSRVA